MFYEQANVLNFVFFVLLDFNFLVFKTIILIKIDYYVTLV